MSSLLHSEENFGIVVHGGAGVMSGLSEERQQQIHKKIQETVSEAYEILEKGGSSFDAVELAVSMLEDSPLFNAGRGSVYNSDEVQEMDASIMDGKNRLSGAVASVSTVKNPIKLARKVAEETKHVLLVGEGAERFARDIGVDIVDRNYFYHEERLKRLLNSKNKISKLNENVDKIGSVGAVALDKTKTWGRDKPRHGFCFPIISYVFMSTALFSSKKNANYNLVQLITAGNTGVGAPLPHYLAIISCNGL